MSYAVLYYVLQNHFKQELTQKLDSYDKKIILILFSIIFHLKFAAICYNLKLPQPHPVS